MYTYARRETRAAHDAWQRTTRPRQRPRLWNELWEGAPWPRSIPGATPTCPTSQLGRMMPVRPRICTQRCSYNSFCTQPCATLLQRACDATRRAETHKGMTGDMRRAQTALPASRPLSAVIALAIIRRSSRLRRPRSLRGVGILSRHKYQGHTYTMLQRNVRYAHKLQNVDTNVPRCKHRP